MFRLLSIVGLSVLTVACGGGSDDSGKDVAGFTGNGIYVNNNDLAVMIVDSKRQQNNVIVGDFAYSTIFFVDSVTTTNNQLKAKGITYADTSVFIKDPNQEMTINFTEDTATLSATVNDTNVMYSMDKTSSSLALTDLIGTHTNPNDGTTWTINDDGSLIVNGICTITGQLKRNGDYYDITDANAVACSDTSLNGTYSGVLLSVEYSGDTVIGGLLGNDNALLWGSAPKN